MGWGAAEPRPPDGVALMEAGVTEQSQQERRTLDRRPSVGSMGHAESRRRKRQVHVVLVGLHDFAR